ncbi:glutamyl-tRNA(Gln) amidotransferase subunit C, mitochondrial-like [Pollicipes pollicipes]|uniref:glutamyl-tRNA(Gln) amidotransferase subunit C, mitochondrial-like n=1 Tax=Pollicipes pollicipes TaxID=41117 RepID=UPI0018850401|nr:glutamyl-tRNA(Gln) amidotransferase subunit C, mitochondrial-like [Pollicipes pollicipes]
MISKMRLVNPFPVYCLLRAWKSGVTSVKNVSSYHYIPSCPTTIDTRQHAGAPIVTEEDIILLERLSLVDFGNRQGVQRLTEAIKFADTIRDVCTEGIEPLYTVLEDRNLRLRPDVVEEAPSVDEITSCAALTEDDYFVAPPGNVPLEVLNTYQEEAAAPAREREDRLADETL